MTNSEFSEAVRLSVKRGFSIQQEAAPFDPGDAVRKRLELKRCASQASSGKASAASSTVSRASRCSGDNRRTSIMLARSI